MKGKVLVLGTDFQHSITVIRSLARAGYYVIVGRAASDRSYTENSRSVSGVWEYRSSLDNPRQFVSELAAEAAAEDISLVFPVGEGQLSAIDSARGLLPADLPVVIPEKHALWTCLQKDSAYTLAQEAGVPVPSQAVARNLRELKEAAAVVGFPCVVKPQESQRPFFGRKAVICDSPDMLAQSLPEWPNGNDLLIVQSRSSGRRHNCDLLAERGKLIEYFEMAIRRTNRYDGTGLSVDLVSVRPTPSLQDHCRRILAKLDYTGPAMIQFIVDEESGEARFLEINPRLDAFCGAARAAGCDMPARAARLYLEGSEPPTIESGTYRIGHRTHWLRGDILGLRYEMKNQRIDRMTALRWAARIPWCFVRADSHLTWDWRDPRPTLTLFARLLDGKRPFRFVARHQL